MYIQTCAQTHNNAMDNDNFCIIAYSALTRLVGRQEGHLACKKLSGRGAGMVVCLEQAADLHTAQLMSLPLTVSCFSKIQIGFTFWYRLTRVVPDKGPLNVCVCVDNSFLYIERTYRICTMS